MLATASKLRRPSRLAGALSRGVRTAVRAKGGVHETSTGLLLDLYVWSADAKIDGYSDGTGLHALLSRWWLAVIIQGANGGRL